MGLANEVRERLSTSVISEHSMERMALGAVFVFRTVCFSMISSWDSMCLSAFRASVCILFVFGLCPETLP